MTQQDDTKQAALELLILSIASLLAELLVIRWMSTDVRAFTVFKTLPLVTCFLGLGVGMAFGRKIPYRMCAIAMLWFTVLMKLSEWLGFSRWPFPSLTTYQWQHLEAISSDLPVQVFLFMLVVILWLMGPFSLMATIGGRIGGALAKLPPLRGYSVNIIGAILGSILFTVLSFFGWPPAGLLAVLAVLFVISMSISTSATRRTLALSTLIMVPAVGLSTLAFHHLDQGETVFWSPYQRINVVPLECNVMHQGQKEKVNLGVLINSNWQFYQFALDLSPQVIDRPELPAALRNRLDGFRRRYEIPYQLKRPGNVLIVGAGSGTDVGAALRYGARHIDAVDIDPTILKLGKELNPAHPYQSDKVRIICNDARNFLSRAKEKYDLIVFSYLDSQTVVGSSSSVRLDNYVYTKESLAKASQLLTDDGIAVVTFGTSMRWLSDRLFHTIEAAVGYPPMVIAHMGDNESATTIFVFGEPVRRKTLSIAKDIRTDYQPASQSGRILTDDWPYLYLGPVVFDVPYLLVMAEIILLSVFASRRMLFRANPPVYWQLFFQGGAFLLLELQAITKLSLLFGSTWLTSALVINGILIMILAANFIVATFRTAMAKHNQLVWCLLYASLLLSYSIPIAQLASGGFFEHLLVTFSTILPMALAGILFASAFESVKEPPLALGMNLLGAILGAMLEYLSNYTGINNLVLIAFLLYATANFFCFKSRSVVSAAVPSTDI